MLEEKMEMFRNRLTKVFRHLSRQARRVDISCYRVYDHDIPEFPFSIEIYGDHVYMAEYKREHGMEESAHQQWAARCRKITGEVLGIPEDNIFTKLRQRKPGRLGQYQRIDTRTHEFVVNENKLKFIVNLSDYLDTGLFLDHRDTRKMAGTLSRDKDVLNLFAYTGSFSVYATAGGARSVTTIDLSNTYVQWARRNMALNGFDDQPGENRYAFIQADVKQWIRQARDESADLIIMDPPTFSNSKRMDDFLDIQQDHVMLINECLRILRPGGILIFSTNLRTFKLDSAAIRTTAVRDITKATTPFDFTGRLWRWCYRFDK